MNAPPRSESYRLAEGERKCEWKDSANEKMPNSGTLTVNREDHTVGNLIRMCVRAGMDEGRAALLSDLWAPARCCRPPAALGV
jgi:hypothetical protein